MFFIGVMPYDFPQEDLYLNSFHFPLFTGVTGNNFVPESSYKFLTGFTHI